VSERAKYFTDVSQWFHSSIALLKFYVLFWVADFDEEIADAVTVVALQHDLPVLVGAAAGAKRFQFMRDLLKVAVFVFNAVDNSGWSAELSGFKPYANPLLLFLYFPTNA
jgi:hypothetical protein